MSYVVSLVLRSETFFQTPSDIRQRRAKNMYNRILHVKTDMIIK